MEKETRNRREIIREEMYMRDKILSAVKDGPKTVPEIAKILEYPEHEVMYWVMAARKYGYLEESPEASDEGYYTYILTNEQQ